MKRRKSPFTTAQIRQAIQVAKAEGFDRAELISPDGTRAVFERKVQDKGDGEGGTNGKRIPPVEELEI